MESFLSDLKHGLRMLRQSPSFTITAVAALALGIGANTAIFTVIDTVIFQPLPYPNSERIVNVGRPGGGNVSEPLFTYWIQNSPGLEDLTAYHAGASMNLNGGDRPELVETTTASRNYFRLFGARPLLGRTFTAAEDVPGGVRVMVLSYGLWQRRFGADPSILGKTIALGGAPLVIVGVLSPGFRPYPPADVWIPLQADSNSTNLANILSVSGRLPNRTTLTEVNAQLAAIDKRYVETHSERFRIEPRTRAVFMLRQITGDIRPALLILLGAVGLVLLIACANVANLLLARAAARQKEIAIRAALGAGRGRLVRQLLTESLLLALAGGAAGLALGSWAVRALLTVTPGDLPRLPEIAAIPALDARVAGFTFLMALLTGALFGLVPAFQLARTELSAALNESGGRTGSGRKQNRVRGVLVAAEMAIAVVLLCGALLLIRSFAAMHSVNLGFNPHNLLTMEVSLAGPGYSKSDTVDRLARQFTGRAERLPGVEAAALASALPLWGRMDMIFDIPGRVPPADGRFTGDVQWRFVSAHYFDVLQIPLLAGRFLHDQEPGRTVVVSQAMARKFWPGANAVGQTIFIGRGLGPAYQVGVTEIVGVVGDVRERLNFDFQPVMYQAPSQIPDADMALLNGYEPGAILIRTRPGVPPFSVSLPVQQALMAANQLPAAKVRTMERASLDSTARQNFNLLLLGLFAAMALLLAAVGIYGVMSYSVEQRTHEIGIRAALGANRRDTLSLVLRQALRMTMAGVGAGIAASFGLTRLLSAELFRVKSWDPLTFAAVPLVLLAVALAAACIPALRATRIDPLTALRHE
ncbi:MAG TPA: ABC transporter permease [Candidatus Acidoferrales bacterium]|nr:ABC transporter permease [Candidatus Acidoferrales bacterium]